MEVGNMGKWLPGNIRRNNVETGNMEEEHGRGKPVRLCWIYNGLESDSTNHNQGTQQAVLEWAILEGHALIV